MTVLGGTAGGIYFALPGKQSKAQAPPIKASSKDEEAFIQYVECFNSTIIILGISR